MIQFLLTQISKVKAQLSSIVNGLTTEQANIETGLDITRCGNIRTLRIGKTVTNAEIAVLSKGDRPKMSVNAVMRHKNTSDVYKTALVTVGDDGVISGTIFDGSSISAVSSGTLTGTITYIV